MIELATTEKKQTKAARVREYVAKNPKASTEDIANATGATDKYVYSVMWNAKQARKKAGGMAKKKALTNKSKNDWRQLGLFSSNTPVYDATDLFTYDDSVPHITPERLAELTYAVSMGDQADPVNSPSHYSVGGIETIDFIEAKKLNYRLGNVVKYLTRADHKGNKLEDLKKAQWYLEREIESLS